MAPTPLPRLQFPSACTPPVVGPATDAQCQEWASQAEALRSDAQSATDINERKALMSAIGRLARLMQLRGCQ